MPELPEVEAWVRELDPLVSRSPIEKAGPAHVATLKTFVPPLSELDGRRFEGARRRGQEPSLPGRGRAISSLRVHLMSAGTLRYLEPGEKRPKTPDVPRSASRTATSSSSPRRGKKKRAGVWLVTQDAARATISRHLGPDALALDAAALGEILHARAPTASPAPPRPARDRRHRTRARERDPPARAALPVQGVDGALATRRSSGSQPRCTTISTRALELREQGKGDSGVYRVHNRLGEPCPQCGTPIARVDFEEHTIYYCPSCQTGGRLLEGSTALAPAALTSNPDRRSSVRVATVAACRPA